MTNFVFDNNYVVYALTTTVVILGSLVIKSYFYSTVIETPNSPKTFNFTPQQMIEINELMDEGDFIKSGKTCYPLKYPMRSVEEPISELSNFDLDFPRKDFIDNLSENMDNLSISKNVVNIPCSLEPEDILPIIPWQEINDFCMNYLTEIDIFNNEFKLFLDILNNLT